MPRLRTVSPKDPGWTRRRAGKGFIYLDDEGTRLPSENIERCKMLVIPPAWEQVWICPAPNGHIQAVGTDDAGRRQYIYHEYWRLKRDKSKHDRVLQVASRLPRARRKVAVDLRLPGMPYERALATAFRLLDLGFFRIGGEAYAEANNSYGLATIRKEDVSHRGQEGRSSTSSRNPARSATSLWPTSWCGPRSAICWPSRTKARNCWRTRTATAGATSPRPRSTTTSRARSAARCRPRTSAPGTAR